MSLTDYIERQDRAFDTFRSKYRLHDAEVIPKTHEIRSSVHEPVAGRSISTTTLEDATGQLDLPDTLEIPTQLVFSPQIRKLEVAPWEDGAEPQPLPNRPKTKKSRTSILKKLRRVTSGTKSAAISEETARESTPELCSSSSSSSELKVNSHQASSGMTRRSDIPLGRPLNTSELQGIHAAIAFQPINPNIVQLKAPLQAGIKNDGSRTMKPSRSTPQIEEDLLKHVNRTERMSRMFDNLRFD